MLISIDKIQSGMKGSELIRIHILLLMTVLVIGCDCDKSNSDFADVSGAPINLTLEDESHYFILSDPNDTSSKFFSKTGEFYISDTGEVSDINGYILEISHRSILYPTASPFSFNLQHPVLIPNIEEAPRATKIISVNLNLPSDAIQLSDGGIDSELNVALSAIPVSTVTPSISNYNHSTSIFIFDSLGGIHTLKIYYVHTDTLNIAWEVRATIDALPLMSSGILSSTLIDFDYNGVLDEGISTSGGIINFLPFDPFTGASPIYISIDFRKSTSRAWPFEVHSVVQDGFISGKATKLIINEEGYVSVDHNNLETRPLGRIALAKFQNTNELIQNGNAVWVKNPDIAYIDPEIVYSEAGGLGIASPLVIDLQALLNN